MFESLIFYNMFNEFCESRKFVCNRTNWRLILKDILSHARNSTSFSIKFINCPLTNNAIILS